ncbi:MFS transporter [Chloroflexota bacterium]
MIVMLDAFSWTVIFPLLPYYALTYGANLFTIGLLAAISPVVELLSAPIHRFASKKIGRKPILVISQLGMVLGYLVLGFAQTLGMLFLARIIDGFAGTCSPHRSTAC